MSTFIKFEACLILSPNAKVKGHTFTQSCPVIKLSQNGVGHGYIVAVTGLVWQLRGLCGSCKVFVLLTGRLPRTPLKAIV